MILLVSVLIFHEVVLMSFEVMSIFLRRYADVPQNSTDALLIRVHDRQDSARLVSCAYDLEPGLSAT